MFVERKKKQCFIFVNQQLEYNTQMWISKFVFMITRADSFYKQKRMQQKKFLIIKGQ